MALRYRRFAECVHIQHEEYRNGNFFGDISCREALLQQIYSTLFVCESANQRASYCAVSGDCRYCQDRLLESFTHCGTSKNIVDGTREKSGKEHRICAMTYEKVKVARVLWID